MYLIGDSFLSESAFTTHIIVEQLFELHYIVLQKRVHVRQSFGHPMKCATSILENFKRTTISSLNNKLRRTYVNLDKYHIIDTYPSHNRDNRHNLIIISMPK